LFENLFLSELKEATASYSAKSFEGWASEKIALRKFSGKEYK